MSDSAVPPRSVLKSHTDCIVQRFAGIFVPRNGRLALVGDTDGGDIAHQIAERFQFDACLDGT